MGLHDEWAWACQIWCEIGSISLNCVLELRVLFINRNCNFYVAAQTIDSSVFIRVLSTNASSIKLPSMSVSLWNDIDFSYSTKWYLFNCMFVFFFFFRVTVWWCWRGFIPVVCFVYQQVDSIGTVGWMDSYIYVYRQLAVGVTDLPYSKCEILYALRKYQYAPDPIHQVLFAGIPSRSQEPLKGLSVWPYKFTPQKYFPQHCLIHQYISLLLIGRVVPTCSDLRVCVRVCISVPYWPSHIFQVVLFRCSSHIVPWTTSMWSWFGVQNSSHLHMLEFSKDGVTWRMSLGLPNLETGGLQQDKFAVSDLHTTSSEL